MKKLKRLTSEQEAYIPILRKRYEDMFYHNNGIDKRLCQDGIEWLYSEYLQLDAPLVMYAQSPIEAQLLINAINLAPKADLTADLGVNLWHSLRSNLENSLGASLGASLKSNIEDNFWNNLWSNLGTNLWANLENNLKDSLRDNLRADLKSNLEDNLKDDVWSTLWDNLKDNLWTNLKINLRDNLEDSLEDSLLTNLKNNLGTSLEADLRDNLTDNLWDNLGDNLEVNLQNNLRIDLRDNLWVNIGTNIKDNLVTNLQTNLKTNLGYLLWDDIWNNIKGNIKEDLWNNLKTDLENNLNTELWVSLRDNFRHSLGADLGDNLWDDLRTYLWGNLWGNFWGSLWGNLRADVRGNLQYTSPSYWVNIGDYGWVAFYDFIQSTDHFKGYDFTQFNKYKSLLESGLYEIHAYKGVCIVTAMPKVCQDENNRLHNTNGSAVTWPDGFSMWYYHGMNIPGHWIEDKDSITADEVKKESNAEKRRALRDLMGTDRYYDVLGGVKEIDRDTDDYGNEMVLYESKKDDDVINRKVQYLEVICPSSMRKYVLYPTKNCSNVWDAKASTFNDRPIKYRHGDVGLESIERAFDRPIMES